MEFLQQTKHGVEIKVHIQPRASKNEIIGTYGGRLKITLTSPPVEDAANKKLAEFLADLLGIKKSAVALVSGTKSRRKTLRIDGVSVEEVKRALEKVLSDKKS